jgi:two-component system response regulator YesN
MILTYSKLMTKHKKICEGIIMTILKCDGEIIKDLNCSKLALMVGFNRSYLSRIFKECKGIYLRDSIKRLKLLRSALLMFDKRDLTVKEIAVLCGFGGVDYFINSFKKFFGMTPGKFKKCI